MEELDAAGEVVERQARIRVEQDAGRQARAEEDGQRPEVGERQADREPAHAGHAEAAFDPGEEDAGVDRGRRVGVGDDVAAGVDLDDPADQLRVELPAEHVSLDRDADRRDADDRELPGEQLADIDLDALDRAGELEPVHALDAGDARRQCEDEVRRVVDDVVPLEPDRVDVDRQPARPREAVAVGTADGEDDTEVRARCEAAVAVEREVARLTGDDHAADGHLGADGREAHERVVRAGAGVDVEVRGRERQERAEVDRELVGVEDERLERAVRVEGEGGRHGDGAGIRPVGDRAVDRLAGQEVDAARRDHESARAVGAAVERHGSAGPEGDAEVLHADAQVLEAQEPEEVDPAGGREDQVRLADLEPVRVHGQTGGHNVRVRVGERNHVGADTEEREHQRRRPDGDEGQSACDRLTLRRVVVDVDGARGDVDDVWDVNREARDVQRELAGDAEGVEQAGRVTQRMERLHQVDLDVEGAKDAGELGADAARAGAAEAERRVVDADRDRHRQDALGERGACQPDRRALERQRPERDRVARRARRRVARRDGEARGSRGALKRSAAAGGRHQHRPARADELHVDLAADEHVGLREADAGHECIAVRRRAQLGRGAWCECEMGGAGAGQADLIAVDPLERSAGDARAEHDVDVRPRLQRLQAERRAVQRAREPDGSDGRCGRAGRRRDGGRLEEEELLRRHAVRVAGSVGEGVGQELDADRVVRVGRARRRRDDEAAGERVAEEVRVRRVGLERMPVEHDVRGRRAREHELGRVVEDGRDVQPEAAVVGDDDVDVPGRVQRVDGHVLAVERRGELGSRRRRGRRRQARVHRVAHDREAVDGQLLELEAEAAAERELCVALDCEDLRQRPVDRHADPESRGRDVDVDAAARLERERDVTADRDDVGGAQRDARALDLRDVRARRERHGHRARVGAVRQCDDVRHGLAGLVDVHRDRADDRETVDPDERRRARRVDREVAADLHGADRAVRDQQADRVRVDGAVVEAVRPVTEEDLDVRRAVHGGSTLRAASDREVAGEDQEVAERDLRVGEPDRPAMGRRVDEDRLAVDDDRRVDGLRRRVEREHDLRVRLRPD